MEMYGLRVILYNNFFHPPQLKCPEYSTDWHFTISKNKIFVCYNCICWFLRVKGAAECGFQQPNP